MADEDDDTDEQESGESMDALPEGFVPWQSASAQSTQTPSLPEGFVPWQPTAASRTPTQSLPEGFEPWQGDKREPAEPEAEGMLATFARKARDAVLPTLGGISGGALAAGAAAGAGRVLGGAAGGFLGGPGGAVAGWLGGGLAGGYLGEKVYSAGKELLGYDDSIQQAVNAKTNPWSSAAGEVAPLALGLTPTTAAPRIGAKFLESPIGQRLLSGAVSGGAEAGMQVAQGEYDPTRLVTSLAAGAALPGNRGWVSGLEQRGEALAGRIASHGTPGAKAAAGTAEEQAPPPPDPAKQQPGADERYAKEEPTAQVPPGEEAATPATPPEAPRVSDPTLDAALQAKLKPEAPETPAAPAAPEPAPEPPLAAPDAIPGPEAQARPPEPAPEPETQTAAAARPAETVRGPFAREVGPQHMPWYDRGYAGGERGGNEAEQAAWDRGALDRSNAARAAATPLAGEGAPAKTGPASGEDPNAARSALDAIKQAMQQPDHPEPAPQPPAKFSIAKDTDTGRHVLFRNGEEVGDFANRGAAEQARTKAIRLERIREAAARANQIAAEPDETAPEGTPRPLGAAAADPNATPGAPPVADKTPMGRLSDFRRDAYNKLLDIGHDIQMKISPMTRGNVESMPIAKDLANAERRINTEWSIRDQNIVKRHTPEERTRIYNAMNEESEMQQRGESSEHMGIATLTPKERRTVDEVQGWAKDTWARMREAGMVEGQGLPFWTPRKLINAATSASEEGGRSLNRIGANLRTTAPSLQRRKYLDIEDTEAAMRARFGEQAEVARDIRTVPFALAELERAIAGRQLINAIRAAGKRTGQETIAEGSKPTDSEHKWFTLDHPAFSTWRPKFEEADTATYRDAVKRSGGVDVPPGEIPLLDRNGEMVFEKVPLYVRGDFEGPLKAVLNQPSGLAYKTAMDLKGKTMGLVMNSPLIHNGVEWGRALPAMPGKVATFKVYFEGNAAKRGVPFDGTVRYVKDLASGKFEEAPLGASPDMIESINAGGVPIGKRFFNQDINSVLEEPNMTPGRSWTAKVLGAVPGLFDPKAGDAVKRSIDRAGDFWHNTMLWDRVEDLRMGLYVNHRDELIKDGANPRVAQIIAAHMSNRYAGVLPQEAMSNAARKFANLLLFSRSFTLGNLGVLKDAITGLPRDVQTQIQREFGSVDPKTVAYATSVARRKAISVVMLDMGLMYLGNSLLQSGINMLRGDKTLDDESKGYVNRLHGALQNVREDPMMLLQPFKLIEKLSSTAENEPGKQDRILVGHAKDGTAIYMRNPTGKIGEEFVGWATGPLDMLKRKLGTFARPAWQILSNDQGFGRKVYDPNADTPAKYIKNMGLMVQQIVKAQTPEGQIRSAADLATGQGDPNVAAAQTFGPLAGVTFSHGAPGGPAMGEVYHAREQHNFEVNEAMPNIRRMIQRGDEQGARQRMRDLGIPPGLQNFYVKTTKNPTARLSPRAVQDFNIYATPEQRERFQRQKQLVQ